MQSRQPVVLVAQLKVYLSAATTLLVAYLVVTVTSTCPAACAGDFTVILVTAGRGMSLTRNCDPG